MRRSTVGTPDDNGPSSRLGNDSKRYNKKPHQQHAASSIRRRRFIVFVSWFLLAIILLFISKATLASYNDDDSRGEQSVMSSINNATAMLAFERITLYCASQQQKQMCESPNTTAPDDDYCHWCYGTCLPSQTTCSHPFLEYQRQLLLAEKDYSIGSNKNGQVCCGGHWAPTCSDCPRGNGRAWCNGQCSWLSTTGQCVSVVDFHKETGCGLVDKLNSTLLDDSSSSPDLDIDCHNIQEVTLNKKLGEGDYREVHRGHWRGKTVAVKILKPLHRLQAGYCPLPPYAARQEASLMYQLRDEPNIMDLHGFCNGTIITSNGVGDMAHIRTSALTQQQRLRYALQIAQSVQQLHSMGSVRVAHGDLHLGQMILINGSLDAPHVVLGDYDTVSFVGEEESCRAATRFTTTWMSPEQLYGTGDKAFTQESDIFMLASMIWSLLANIDISTQIKKDAHGVPMLEGKTLSQDGYASDIDVLLEECWRLNPKLRPNVSSVVSRLERVLSLQ